MTIFDQWYKEILTDSTAHKLVDYFDIDKPKYIGFDTEGTGLNIYKDKPFLIIVGWYNKVFVFEPTEILMKAFFRICEKALMVFAWNTKFDLHMLKNIGYSYPYKNLSDGMIVARLILDADDIVRLGLKAISKTYVTKDADVFAKSVKSEIESLKKQRLKIFDNMLKEKGMTRKEFETICKDVEQSFESLPENIQEVYFEWENNIGLPTYADVDRDLMKNYAFNDVIIMIEFLRKALPILETKQQVKTFRRENNCILPYFRQEQVGFNIDMDYLVQAKQNIKDYLQECRSKLYAIAGQHVTVGQHAKLKQIFKEKFNVELVSVNKTTLPFILDKLEPQAKAFGEIILELRTLEKWYSTYILRFENDVKKNGVNKIFTQIMQTGAVSGRVASDFQQFPKNPLYHPEKLAKVEEEFKDKKNLKEFKDEYKNALKSAELFHPRRFIKPSGGNYNTLYYFDYSQVELRCQAHYTMKIGSPDKNLCRAYMPFECYEKDGKWYKNENNEEWHPTDLHAQTAVNAFGEDCVNRPDFKSLRSAGKTANFACNYGAGVEALIVNPTLRKFSKQQIEQLVKAYKKTFPGIKAYQDTVQNTIRKKGFVTNEFGRRYYISNSRFAYKTANYLVQGSCADFLKETIIEIDNFLIANNYKSRMVMNIHDEIVFEIYEGEEHILKNIKYIMENSDWCLCPIVVECERTSTTWAEKGEYHV